MLLKTRLQDYKNRYNARWEIIEQDYILSWILAGLVSVEELRETLVFKGGTCLRKCYFGDYRFSQDIDLSVIKNHESLENSLHKYIEKSSFLAESFIQNQGEGIYLQCSPYKEKKPHPEGQQAFLVQAKLPWHREFLTKVYIEVSFGENLILPPSKRSIIHPYEECFDFSIASYDINEIVAEKIRALLQFSKKLHERGWGRSRVRDYYDLWRILGFYKEDITKTDLPSLVIKKCSYKGIEFKQIEDIFDKKLMENAQEEWDLWLRDIVVSILPNREVVFAELKTLLAEIFN